MAVSRVPVHASDAESLAAVRVTAMREGLEALGRLDPERARSRLLAGFTAEFTRAIVEEGRRVGFVVVRPLADHLLLDHLVLSPADQGRGTGSDVLRIVFAEADAADKPLRVGALRGSRSNAFYMRHGFVLVEVAEWDCFYVRPPRSRAARAHAR